ncbi:hypothetical protein [Marinicellulosiphila megalodicopiae]|uniref:hypothetical protein n=1 Tax=Marinicellulosiphila megalodicopiae TaxID=2724896 RepID=UPI003BB1CBE7
MGVAIYYNIEENPNNKTIEQIADSVKDLESSYDWYIEPFALFESDGDLSGSSKLFHLFDDEGNELDPSEESPKVMKDIDYLIEILATISKESNIIWQLEIEGSPIGNISTNGPDEMLSETLEEMLVAFSGDFSDEHLDVVSSKSQEKVRHVEVILQETPKPVETPKKPWWKFWS